MAVNWPSFAPMAFMPEAEHPKKKLTVHPDPWGQVGSTTNIGAFWT